MQPYVIAPQNVVIICLQVKRLLLVSFPDSRHQDLIPRLLSPRSHSQTPVTNWDLQETDHNWLALQSQLHLNTWCGSTVNG